MGSQNATASLLASDPPGSFQQDINHIQDAGWLRHIMHIIMFVHCFGASRSLFSFQPGVEGVPRFGNRLPRPSPITHVFSPEVYAPDLPIDGPTVRCSAISGFARLRRAPPSAFTLF